MKLWASSALTPYGNEYGLVAVIAETREEAITKANSAITKALGNYVPDLRYAEALLENITAMSEVTDEVIIDWDAAKATGSNTNDRQHDRPLRKHR
jgi:hypothetical protein